MSWMSGHESASLRLGREAGARWRLPWGGWGALGLGVLTGTLLQLQQAHLLASAWYGAALIGGLCGALCIRLFDPGGEARRSWRAPQAAVVGCLLVALLAGVVAWGAAGLRAAERLQQALAPELEGRDLLLEGQVASLPQSGAWGWRFVFQVESARLQGRPVAVPGHLLLGWNPLQHPARPVGDDDALAERELVEGLPGAVAGGDPALGAPQSPVPGQRWRLTARLKRVHGARNPGGFDHELWLWEQGILASGWVRAGSVSEAPRLLASPWAFPIERLRHRVREAMVGTLGSDAVATPGTGAGVVVALVTGDQRSISREDWVLFRQTGVAHLMSISGLHITLLAWLTARGLSGLWRQTARWPGLLGRACLWCPAPLLGRWAGLSVAPFYSAFCGWGIPAQRTVGMLALVCLLQSGGRRWPWTSLWSVMVALVLLLDPWACLQPGFWLSFVAVGLLFATDGGGVVPLAGGAAKEAHAAIGQTPLALPAGRLSRVLAPVRAHAWGRWALTILDAARSLVREQWVLGLALAPLSLLLFGQVSLVGLLANLVAVPWVTAVVTPLALLGCALPPLWWLAQSALQGLMWGLQWLAGWPGATWSTAVAPVWAAIAGGLGGVLCVGPWPRLWRGLGLPLMVPVLMWQVPGPAPGRFELLAVDVGQGAAVWLRTATHGLLYDAGPRYSPGSDAGERVLVPLLRAQGASLDTLMLSHRDTDHTGGAASVLQAFPRADLRASWPGRQAVPERLARPCLAGERWQWDGVRFEVLHPLAAEVVAGARSNALSCVLRVEDAQGRSALLSGDIELEQERALLARGAALRSDFLLVPHHGSGTSSSDAFLQAVRPSLAVVQAGYRNRFGHPAGRVMARYAAQGIAWVSTPECGAVHWSSEQPDRWTCQRELDRRYWHWPLSP